MTAYLNTGKRFKFLRLTLLILGFILLNSITAPLPPAHAAVGCGPNTYKENPRLRKQKSQTALYKAMELNAKVVMMLQQGSDQYERMVKMLSESYGFQVVSIGQMEGLVRESCFKDPVIERGIKEMYDHGKPNTQAAENLLRMGNMDINTVLSYLAEAKKIHQKFLLLTY